MPTTRGQQHAVELFYDHAHRLWCILYDNLFVDLSA
jgi:hypothetical protein